MPKGKKGSKVMCDPLHQWAEAVCKRTQEAIDKVIVNTMLGKKAYKYRRKCRSCNGAKQVMMHASLCDGYSNPCPCPFCGMGNCRTCEGTGKEVLTRWRMPDAQRG